MVQVRKKTPARAPRVPATPRAAAACRRPVDGLLDPALFKALGDPTRVRLLACLMKCGRACLVGEVAECCAVDLSVVSRHLQALARAGVVDSAREGRMVAYRVRYGELATRLRELAAAIEACAPADAVDARAARVGRATARSAGPRCEGGRRGCC
ncbi:MAG: HTH-type transcriptional repressor SmtB [Planctomycetota bacterium]